MTLTLDNLPTALADVLARKAASEGRTVADVALDALRRGLASSEPHPAPPLPRDLSDVAGTWQDDPAFDEALNECRWN
jgi:hypothetical protein